MYFKFIETQLKNNTFYIDDFIDGTIPEDFVCEEIEIRLVPEESLNNKDEVLYGSVTVLDFIKNNISSMKNIPFIKRRYYNASPMWVFDKQLEFFVSLFIQKYKENVNIKILNKYPIWKQITLKNDYEYSMDNLLSVASHSKKKILEVISHIYSYDKLKTNKYVEFYEKDIEELHNREPFVDVLKTMGINDIKYYNDVVNLIEYHSYYCTILRARAYIAKNEEMLKGFSTIEEVVEFIPEYVYI